MATPYSLPGRLFHHTTIASSASSYSTATGTTASPAASPYDGASVAHNSPLQTAMALPPFLTKTYDMVQDRATDSIISWSAGHNSFIVWDPAKFCLDVLPQYFKHSNFSSFIRQLNTYGFRKVDPDRWEFANECFLRGQRHLLKNIQRRRSMATENPLSYQHETTEGPGSTGHCIEVGKLGLEGEIEQLNRDKNLLLVELVRLRQQQRSAEQDLHSLVLRLQSTEQRQQQLMAFLAQVLRSGSLFSQLVQQTENQEAPKLRKKRRLPWQGEEEDAEPSIEGLLVRCKSGCNDFLSPLSPNFSSLENEASELYWLGILFRDMVSSLSSLPQEPMSQQGSATITKFQEFHSISRNLSAPAVDNITTQTSAVPEFANPLMQGHVVSLIPSGVYSSGSLSVPETMASRVGASFEEGFQLTYKNQVHSGLSNYVLSEQLLNDASTGFEGTGTKCTLPQRSMEDKEIAVCPAGIYEISELVQQLAHLDYT